MSDARKSSTRLAWWILVAAALSVALLVRWIGPEDAGVDGIVPAAPSSAPPPHAAESTALTTSARENVAPLSVPLDPLVSTPVRFSGLGESDAERLQLTAIATAALPIVGAVIDASADPLASYAPSDPRNGRITYLHPPPMYVSACSGAWVLASLQVDGSEELLEFALDGDVLAPAWGSIDLCVVRASDGLPPGAQELGGVHLSRSRNAPTRGVAEFRDERGCVHIQRVPPGRVYVHVKYGGYTLRTFPVDMLPGQRVDLGTVAIEEAALLIGSVVSATGEVIEAEVCALDISTGATLSSSHYIVDYFGDHFALDELPPGEVHLSVRAPKWAANPTALHVRQGHEIGTKLVAEPGVLVQLQSSRNVARAVEIRQGERWIWTGELERLSSVSVWLLPGRYSLRYRTRDDPLDAWRTDELEVRHGVPVRRVLE